MTINNLQKKPVRNVKIVLPPGSQGGTIDPAMKKPQIPTKVVLRPTPEDWQIVQQLRARLGVDNSQILRIALRRLLEAEGLQLKAS